MKQRNFLKSYKIAISGLIFISLVLGMLSSAFAFSVTPIHVEMGTVGRDARATITASNDSGSRIGVDITLVEFELTENGEIVELDGDSAEVQDFLIFPPQAFLEPYASQNFRIQWVGDPEIPQSRSFVATVSEVPGVRSSDKGPSEARVDVALAFAVIVNVRPIEGIASLDYLEGTIEPSPSGYVLKAKLENTSNTHGVLAESNVVLNLFDETGSRLTRRRYTPAELKDVVGIGLVPANSKRLLDFSLKGVASEIISQAKTASLDIESNER